MLRKILIADDNVASQKEMQQLLHNQGYEVLTVGSGDLAIEKIHEFQPHLVMLDVIMPGKSGYEICGYIKNEPMLNQIPVILTFSENEPFDLAEARRAGATRCLPKTIDPDSLITILNFIWAGVTPIEYAQDLSMALSVKLEDNEAIPEVVVEPVSGEDPEPAEEESSPYLFEVKLSDEFPQPEPDLLSEAGEPITVAAVAGGPNYQTEPSNQLFDAPVVEDQFSPPPAEEESQDDPLHIKEDLIANHCRECGARVVAGDVFCVECGVALEDAVLQPSAEPNCEQCGQTISRGDVFCLNCGAVQ